ncbi:RMtype1_S_StySKI-TRD2-CR2_like domain containing protein [Methylophilaceae bacterium]
MNAMHQLLTEHMAIWTATDTEKKSGRGRASGNAGSVYGIKKLRELILELAVRGKLVSQDANDEPASELLKRIQAEKAKLIVPIHEDEKPFELPNGWEHVRLGILFDIVYGKGLSNSELTEDGYDVFGANGIIGKYPKYLYEKPQLLISCRGAYSGKPNISPSKCYVTSNSLVLGSSWKNIDLKYFYYSLSIANKEKIVTGTAQPQVTTTNLEPFVVGLPPLAEQYRIVAKVDELMALCDQLEAQHSNAADAHEKLVSHLLGTLTQSQSADDFSANWQLIAAHFDTLFTTEASIDALKQTLLQLAVMGKLVPQNVNDEPASELLKRIQAEKAKLVAEGKIKKDKPLAPIGEDEKPFELPHGWEWSRLEQIANVISGNAFSSEDFNEISGVKAVKITNAGVHEFIETNDCLPDHYVSKYSDYLIKENDLVLAQTRPYISDGLKISLCPASYNDALLNQRVVAIRIFEYMFNLYVFTYMKSPEVLNFYMNKFNNSGLQPNLKLSDVTDLLITTPPLAEQHRIVAKVDELMALCDQLKTRIQQANQQQQTIANVLVAQVLN